MTTASNDDRGRKAAGLGPAAGWALVATVWLALQTALVGASAVLPAFSTNLLLLGACELLVLGGAALALARRMRHGSLSERLAVRWSASAAVPVGIGLGLSLHPVADALRNVVEAFYETPPDLLEHKLAILKHESLAEAFTLFAVVGFVGPFLEEVFYRGALYTSIAWRAGARWASFVAAVGFVFAHGDVRDWPSLTLVAAVLTWLRSRTATIWSSVACHVAFNCSTLIWVVLGRSGAPGGFWTVAIAGSLAAGLLAGLSHTTRSVS